MRVILLGCKGMLGSKLASLMYDRPGLELNAFDIDTLDILDRSRLADVFEAIKPDVIINSTGFTDVDRAEGEFARAFDINAVGVKNICDSARAFGSLIVHYSTDYVFDGSKTTPYTETDRENPISAYGKSKFAGEVIFRDYPRMLLLRTSWLFGENGKNFVTTIIRLAIERGGVSVVGDQRGSPTYTGDLAEITLKAIAKGLHGIYHVANTGVTSWHGFAVEILARCGLGGIPVTEVDSDAFPRPARRPAFSHLSTVAIARDLGIEIPHYTDALDRYLAIGPDGQ